MAFLSFTWCDRVQLCVTTHIILSSLKLWLPVFTNIAVQCFTLKWFWTKHWQSLEEYFISWSAWICYNKAKWPSNKWILQYWVAALWLKSYCVQPPGFNCVASGSFWTISILSKLDTLAPAPNELPDLVIGQCVFHFSLGKYRRLNALKLYHWSFSLTNTACHLSLNL